MKKKKEVLAGLTTFFTMSYILVVNPAILSAAGLPKDGVVFATAVASGLATLLVGIWADLPFAMAPGMGLNVYFTYSVVEKMGVSPYTALTAVFIEGVLFLLMALFGMRKKIFSEMPKNLALAISAGIGLFIALIGLKNAGIVISSKATLVTLGKVTSPEALITLSALLLIAVLDYLQIPASILIGVFFSFILAVIFGKAHLPSALLGFPKPDAAFKLDFHGVLTGQIIPVILAFLIVDIFDTVGTLAGLASRLGIPLSDDRVGKVLTSDAVGTVIGGLLGTSTVTTYVESASGIAAGGRTGLTAITVGVMFLLSTFLYPIFSAVPMFATSCALIYVGAFMMLSAAKISWNDVTESIPAFLTLIGIPMFFSISDGIGLGFISYVLVKLFTGKWRDLNFVVVSVAFVFAIYFFFHG